MVVTFIFYDLRRLLKHKGNGGVCVCFAATNVTEWTLAIAVTAATIGYCFFHSLA